MLSVLMASRFATVFASKLIYCMNLDELTLESFPSQLFQSCIYEDCDQDNKISFEDFKQSVMKENLLLEAFGPCLPEHQVRSCHFIKLHLFFI